MANPSRKEKIETLLADDPTDPFLWYGLAMEHVSAGDDAQAVAVFRKLVEVAPHYVPGYQQLGQALVRLGQDAQAREAWQQGIEQARRQGNDHAAGEMQGMLEMLD
jgi:Flp pilus assembly protein TadD